MLVALIAIAKEKDAPTIYRDLVMYTLFIFPQFAFAYGIFVFTKHSMDVHDWKTARGPEDRLIQCAFQNNPCCSNANSTDCTKYLSFFSGYYSDSLVLHVSFLAAHFFVYWALLLFLETGIPYSLWCKLKDRILQLKHTDEALSSDIRFEKRRIEGQLNDGLVSDVVIAQSLRKWYGRTIYATRDLNFGVKVGECFGLLGVNGAGKTTTFKMLTGEIPPSHGNSYIHGRSLRGNRTYYLKSIGYCPQFDALNFTLTVREMLTAFAYIRGIPSYRIDYEVERWLYK